MARPRLLLPGTAALLAGSLAAFAGPPVPGTPATPAPAPAEYRAATYRTFDAAGRPVGTAKWHWTSAGGNCCEVYVTSTAKGRLLEYGGTWPFYSDDHGRTWQRVVPVTPLRSGEGAIVAGPRGNVYGIGWDPYTGDHLQGLRYAAATWQVAEALVRLPQRRLPARRPHRRELRRHDDAALDVSRRDADDRLGHQPRRSQPRPRHPRLTSRHYQWTPLRTWARASCSPESRWASGSSVGAPSLPFAAAESGKALYARCRTWSTSLGARA